MKYRVDTAQNKVYQQAIKHFAKKGINRSHKMTRLEKLWWPSLAWGKYFIVRVDKSGLLYGSSTFSLTRIELMKHEYKQRKQHARRILCS